MYQQPKLDMLSSSTLPLDLYFDHTINSSQFKNWNSLQISHSSDKIQFGGHRHWVRGWGARPPIFPMKGLPPQVPHWLCVPWGMLVSCLQAVSTQLISMPHSVCEWDQHAVERAHMACWQRIVPGPPQSWGHGGTHVNGQDQIFARDCCRTTR